MAEVSIPQREQVYGEAVECFTRIAEVWSGILGHHVNAVDVALCQIGLKLVRSAHCPTYSDNSDDIVGYKKIFDMIVGEDMVHASTVAEYFEKKGAS
jgi:hypothetical protein